MQAKELGKYIVADPEICHGQLTFKGTRIFVRSVLKMVAKGMSWDRIIEEGRGSITKEAISEAVLLASESLITGFSDEEIGQEETANFGKNENIDISLGDHTISLLDDLVATTDLPATRSEFVEIAVKFLLDSLNTGLLSLQDLSDEYQKGHNSTVLIERVASRSEIIPPEDVLLFDRYCKARKVSPDKAVRYIIHEALVIQKNFGYELKLPDEMEGRETEKKVG